MPRVQQQFSALSQEGIIDTPGVHANPREFVVMYCVYRFAQFEPESRHVPMAACAVGYRLVREAVDFADLQNAGAKLAKKSAACLCAEIESQICPASATHVSASPS
jgi:hypothetical protein